MNELHLALRPQGSPEISNRIKGNLGEAIVFRIGTSVDYAGRRAFVANAIDPLQDVSRPGIDVMWLHFGQAPAEDELAIHEVKTTSASNLSIVSELKADVEKLFGTDPRRTLPARVDYIANAFEFLENEPAAADRVRDLSANSPSTAERVVLVPSLVHDAASDPEPKLSALLMEIEELGWDGTKISAWGVALNTLDDRLQALSEGA